MWRWRDLLLLRLLLRLLHKALHLNVTLVDGTTLLLPSLIGEHRRTATEESPLQSRLRSPTRRPLFRCPSGSRPRRVTCPLLPDREAFSSARLPLRKASVVPHSPVVLVVFLTRPMRVRHLVLLVLRLTWFRLLSVSLPVPLHKVLLVRT